MGLRTILGKLQYLITEQEIPEKTTGRVEERNDKLSDAQLFYQEHDLPKIGACGASGVCLD